MTTAEVALIMLLVVIKVPLVAWLIWLPFRADTVEQWVMEPEETDGDEGDGGGGGGPRRHDPRRHPPWPRRPRRGPHREHAPASPPRVRAVARRMPQRVA
jgi:hypothetical protein